jgi:hypothetical protein
MLRRLHEWPKVLVLIAQTLVFSTNQLWVCVGFLITSLFVYMLRPQLKRISTKYIVVYTLGVIGFAVLLFLFLPESGRHDRIVLMTAKLVVLGLSALTFIESVSISRLAASIYCCRLPRVATLPLAVGIMFLPVLFSELDRILLVQYCRGAGRGRITTRIRRMPERIGAVGIPLLISILRKIFETNLAISLTALGPVASYKTNQRRWFITAGDVLYLGSAMILFLLWLSEIFH